VTRDLDRLEAERDFFDLDRVLGFIALLSSAVVLSTTRDLDRFPLLAREIGFLLVERDVFMEFVELFPIFDRPGVVELPFLAPSASTHTLMQTSCPFPIFNVLSISQNYF
jgi:hypothetical protein